MRVGAAEQNRLDIFHHMVTLVLNGKLHLAPISKNPQYALDIGTGTGIWASELHIFVSHITGAGD